jgi:hypothetical protein
VDPSDPTVRLYGSEDNRRKSNIIRRTPQFKRISIWFVEGKFESKLTVESPT